MIPFRNQYRRAASPQRASRGRCKVSLVACGPSVVDPQLLRYLGPPDIREAELAASGL